MLSLYKNHPVMCYITITILFGGLLFVIMSLFCADIFVRWTLETIFAAMFIGSVYAHFCCVEYQRTFNSKDQKDLP